MAKKLKKLGSQEHWFDLAKTALTSPVIAGVASYGAVMAAEQLSNLIFQFPLTSSAPAMPKTETAQAKSTQNILNILAQSLPPGLGDIFAFGSQQTFKLIYGQPGQISGQLGEFVKTAGGINPFNLDFVALKAVILLYIASGGNLAGLLTSGGGLISSLLKAAPAAAAIAP